MTTSGSSSANSDESCSTFTTNSDSNRCRLRGRRLQNPMMQHVRILPRTKLVSMETIKNLAAWFIADCSVLDQSLSNEPEEPLLLFPFPPGCPPHPPFSRDANLDTRFMRTETSQR